MSAVAKGQVIGAGVMTGVTVLKTGATSIHALPWCSYWMAWTGTPTGTWAVFVSNLGTANNQAPDTAVAANWAQLTLSVAPTNPAGAAGQTGVDLSGIGYRWAYLQYTNAAGVGSLDVWFNGKS